MSGFSPNDFRSHSAVMEQYQQAVTLPLSLRCSTLISIITTNSLKDIRQLYPNLVEDIFGFRNKQDWGLLELYSKESSESLHSFVSFLRPEGHLLQLAYKLSEDPNIHFNFPISCLPLTTRESFNQGKIPDFYLQKISHSPDGELSAYLNLNAFEFFLFHFIYFIVTTKLASNSRKPEITAYAYLFEEFACYFLPADGITVPACPTSAVTPSPPKLHKSQPPFKTSPSKIGFSPVQNPLSVKRVLDFSSKSPSPAKKWPSVLKLEPATGNLSTIDNSELAHSHVKMQSRQSEVYVEIVTEMCLNYFLLEPPQNQFSPIIGSFFPNTHHMWNLRILIKHLHCFTHTSILDRGMRFPNIVIDPFTNLKSYVMVKHVQKRLFHLLKIVFNQWPLDCTFRAPLEIWLSYVQPWRYAPPSQTDLSFAQRWQKFVTENLMFYTPFLLQVFLRLYRMDLTDNDNSYMLFRVSKVFIQKNLDTMIMEAEIANKVGPMKLPNTSHTSLGSSYYYKPCSPSSFQNSEFSLKYYVPLFSNEVLTSVRRLLTEITSAYQRVSASLSPNSVERNYLEEEKSFFTQVTSWFDEKSFSGDEPFLDARKLHVHLEIAASQLCKLFKIDQQPYKLESETFVDENQNSPYQNLFLKRRFSRGDNRLTKVPKIHRGNPDTQPIRTYEIENLVKICKEVSDFINKKYEREIQELYFRPTFLGRMSQHIFEPPLRCHDIIKSKDMSMSKIDMHLPPRILLRPLASKYFIWKCVLYFLLLYVILGFHPISITFILAFLKISIIFFKVIFHIQPQKKHN